MARANVPKFGNWENEQDVPYTVFFDKARQTKGGKMINPNDPQQNPEMFAHLQPPPPPPKSRVETVGRGAVRPTPEPRVIREEADLRQLGSASGRNEPSYGGRGQRTARSTRPSVASELSFERPSPLHPQVQPQAQAQAQARMMGRGSGSPAWEGSRGHDSSHGTPSRSRLRPTARVDESPEKGAAVPRFGEWNESDPQGAENFTHIFNKVREERNVGAAGGAGNNASSATPKHNSNARGRSYPSNKPKKCCPWW